MALKTQKTKVSVPSFIAAIDDEGQRADSKKLVKIMRAATGKSAKMWGPNIVGFGSYTYKYKSGHGGEWFLAGFAPRKGTMTLYIMPGFSAYGALLRKLGKHKTGKSCLYIKSLDDVDVKVLEQLVNKSVEHMKKRYG